MSKSLGNVVWSRDLVKKHGQNLLRLYLFSKHYRDDIEFDEDGVMSKKPFLEKICLAGMKTSTRTDPDISKLISELLAALDDDLDSPKALETFENICSKTIAGTGLSMYDFERICQVLGIET